MFNVLILFTNSNGLNISEFSSASFSIIVGIEIYLHRTKQTSLDSEVYWSIIEYSPLKPPHCLQDV